MIIRILGEGQFVVEESMLEALNHIDQDVEEAAMAGDQEALARSLSALLGRVRESGQVVPDEVLVESDLILPPESATVDQIRQLLDETAEYPGIIPGD